MNIVRALTLVILSLMMQSTFAAGFSCVDATSKVEFTICLDARLSHMDGQIARVYVKRLATSEDPAGLRNLQRTWIAERNQCQSRECLLRIYRQRLKDIGEKSFIPDAQESWEMKFPNGWWISGVNSTSAGILDAIAVLDNRRKLRQFSVPAKKEIDVRSGQHPELILFDDDFQLWNQKRLSIENFRGLGYCGASSTVLRVVEIAGGETRRLMALSRRLHDEGVKSCKEVARTFDFNGLGAIWLFNQYAAFAPPPREILIRLTSDFDSDALSLNQGIHLVDLNDLLPLVEKKCGPIGLGLDLPTEVSCVDNAIEKLFERSF